MIPLSAKIKNTNRPLYKPFLFCFGLIIVLISILPYFILSGDIYIQSHDNLDGELLNYIYQAKYLFNGSSTIPELMNGILKTGMLPPALGFVLLFKIFQPFSAYVAMQFIVLIAGYVGMFRFLNCFTSHLEISMVVSVLFCYLPFPAVYGLSLMGLPLLIFWFLQLAKREHLFSSYLGILFYSLLSSLSLTGFFCLAFSFIYLLYRFLRHMISHKKLSEAVFSLLPFFMGIFLLFCGYLFTNLSLFREFFLPTSYISHRSEFILSPSSFWNNFKTYFLEGGAYAQSYNKYILILFLLAILLTLIRLIRGAEEAGMNELKSKLLLSIQLFLLVLTISILSALYNTSVIVAFRNHASGILQSFQFDRIYWSNPVLWFIILALSLHLIFEFISMTKLKNLGAGLSILVLLLPYMLTVFNQGNFIIHLKQIRFPQTYDMISWNDFYANDLFEQIESILPEDKSSYRVISIGIYPSVALFHGYYCLDGYSNNYSLLYKHSFREIIENELISSEYNTIYFDNWGNRCYYLSSETGSYCLVRKFSYSYQNIQMNTEAFINMGGKFIFSAAEILNAEEQGFTLVDGSPVTTDSSYYAIWIYEVN